MLKKILKASIFSLFALSSLLLGCKTTQSLSKTYETVYSDSTILAKRGDMILPFNRFIEPMGTVIRYGDPTLEEHSMDCVLTPDGKTLAVEDRYGATFINTVDNKIIFRYEYAKNSGEKNLMSVYSGIKAFDIEGKTHIFWSAEDKSIKKGVVFDIIWNGSTASVAQKILIDPIKPAPNALPNDIAVQNENGETFLYVVLHGNNQLMKYRLKDKKMMWSVPSGMAPFGLVIAKNKVYVTNWAGSVPNLKDGRETAGIPYANVYINPKTGGISSGTVSVFDINSGNVLKEINVGLHPNAIIASPNQEKIFVANGNSDEVSIIDTKSDDAISSISVHLDKEQNPFIGDSPNALAISADGKTLYVANGMDNALAVIDVSYQLSANSQQTTGKLVGFIPTETYPSGIALSKDKIFVANLEGEGARIKDNQGFFGHHQGATVSIMSIPKPEDLPKLTAKVEETNFLFRTKLAQLLPRTGVAPKPVPERIGEPSTFKHVIYIIKENKTYDQVFGDIKLGNGAPNLCIFGDSVTPNQHKLAREYGLMDNYHTCGKSSAEGHQWTDAAMTSDYVERNVRAWFRSYPHVQTDALVYNKNGFIWNDALDHGKTVRIYGEASTPETIKKQTWSENYKLYKDNKIPVFTNTSTISRVRPILAPGFPGEGFEFTDQMRADNFIKELKEYEQQTGDALPQLIIIALPNDHTIGTNPNYPTPRAMVADNDLALGRMIEAVSKSRFWSNTVVFVTEDDTQSGWDHISAYRTTGLVVSPYSKKTGQLIQTNYNQLSMVRTIENILGIPPMNIMDATATPMFNCFTDKADNSGFKSTPNIIPLDEMNKSTTSMRSGIEKKYAELSQSPQFEHVDGGDDDLMNKILWYAAKGDAPFPKNMTLPKSKRDDKD